MVKPRSRAQGSSSRTPQYGQAIASINSDLPLTAPVRVAVVGVVSLESKDNVAFAMKALTERVDEQAEYIIAVYTHFNTRVLSTDTEPSNPPGLSGPLHLSEEGR